MDANKRPMLNPAKSPKQDHQIDDSYQLVRLPNLLIWLGLWSTVIAVSLTFTSLGMSRLLDPGPETSEYAQGLSTSAGTTFEEPEESEDSDSFPIWIFLFLALGCAAGSFLVTQVLIRASSPQQPAKRKSGKKRPSQQLRVVKSSAMSKGRPKRRKSVRAKRKKLPPRAPHHPQVSQLHSPPKVQPKITVLPPQKSPQKGNLVELMDIRNRQSLGSLMRES